MLAVRPRRSSRFQAPALRPTRPATLALPVSLLPPRAVLPAERELLTCTSEVAAPTSLPPGSPKRSRRRGPRRRRTTGPLPPVLLLPPMALVLDEVGAGDGGRCTHLAIDSAPLRASDSDDVGAGRAAVIAADGQVVSERAAGDVQRGGRPRGNRAAEGIVDEGVGVAGVGAVAAADGLVQGEGATGDICVPLPRTSRRAAANWLLTRRIVRSRHSRRSRAIGGERRADEVQGGDTDDGALRSLHAPAPGPHRSRSCRRRRDWR